jgi:putative DNA primase/helicase
MDQEITTTQVSELARNTGNVENLEAKPCTDALTHDSNLFSNSASANGNKWEQIDKNIVVHNADDTSAFEQKWPSYQNLFLKSEFILIENIMGFRDGVYWQDPHIEDDDIPEPPLFICSPLIVLADTRDSDQSSWGKLLSWRDMDKQEHTWVCPAEMLATNSSAGILRELARNGLIISPSGWSRQKLAEYVQTFPPQTKVRVRCVTKTGWYGGFYVLSNRIFGKQEGESLLYQGVANNDFGSAGDLEGWKREVSARAIGNTRTVFSVSMGFAGPLVEMANESGGGFQITGATSQGKTSTVVDPAASVWGHPDRFAKRWRTTDNGLEALCLERNHSTLMLDEIGQSDARETGQSAYLIANNQSKMRMQTEGKNRPLSTWKTLILATGEVNLAQHMAEAGKLVKGGQMARLPSIPADAGVGLYTLECLHDQPDGRRFSDTMKAVTREYFGTAGEAFLEKLTDASTLKEITDNIRGGINEIVNLMEIPIGAGPEVGRVAARFALVAFAGELATRFGITGWDKGEALKAAKRCFGDWLSASVGDVGSDDRGLFRQVSAFLQVNRASRFPAHDISAEDLKRVKNHAGFSLISGENVSFWVEPDAFKYDLCKGFNHTVAVKSLVKAGWLEPGSDRTQKKRRIKAIGGEGSWYYVLTDKALGGDI